MKNKDLLHIPIERYTVYHYDEPKFILNKRLLDQQNAWTNLSGIIEAHELKLVVYDLMKESNDKAEILSLARDIIEIEFQLQHLWGFSQDAMYHRFWEMSKCCCPKLDNSDHYPHQQYISKACIIHGK